jgi:hypothetical protein
LCSDKSIQALSGVGRSYDDLVDIPFIDGAKISPAKALAKFSPFVNNPGETAFSFRLFGDR